VISDNFHSNSRHLSPEVVYVSDLENKIKVCWRRYGLHRRNPYVPAFAQEMHVILRVPNLVFTL
jgi:hypothetical protein